MIWSDAIRGCDVLSMPENMISEEGGLYIWRRHCHKDTDAIVSKDDFLAWCKNQIIPTYLKAPVVSTGRSSSSSSTFIRPGFLSMESIEVGSNRVLSEAKLATLKKGSSSNEFREEFVGIVTNAVNNFGSVFYVGESSNLRNRIHAHARGSTGLLDKLDSLGIDPEHIAVQYLELKGFSKANRQLAEQLLTFSLFAPLTMRPG